MRSKLSKRCDYFIWMILKKGVKSKKFPGAALAFKEFLKIEATNYILKKIERISLFKKIILSLK